MTLRCEPQLHSSSGGKITIYEQTNKFYGNDISCLLEFSTMAANVTRAHCSNVLYIHTAARRSYTRVQFNALNAGHVYIHCSLVYIVFISLSIRLYTGAVRKLALLLSNHSPRFANVDQSRCDHLRTDQLHANVGRERLWPISTTL